MHFLQRHEYPIANNQFIGHCILSKPEKINILDPVIVQELFKTLLHWQEREDIVFVLLSGAGDKGFCAGGDIKFMYHQAKESHYSVVDNFFRQEYQLDLLIHQYKKPIIGWAHGITMGGGMGLFQGCDIRIIEPLTVMAMPESHIGLFPDVGAGFFSRKMPKPLGQFMLLTAMELNDADIMYSQLADKCLEKNSLKDFVNGCRQSTFVTTDKHNILDIIKKHLVQLETTPLNKSYLQQNIREIKDSLQENDIAAFENYILKKKRESAFWLYICNRYFYGSPFTHAVIWQQWLHYESLAITDALHQDEILAKNIIQTDDFLEGVRALIIEKDRKPNWQFKTLQDVDWGKVLSAFF